MSSNRHALGRWGETVAADYLVGKGYKILSRSVRTPYGEIDLIAQTKDKLVFVEVKTRSTDAYGPPEASITSKKREHLINSALYFVQTHPDEEPNWRIDVIAIQRNKNGEQPIMIEWFRNAIQ